MSPPRTVPLLVALLASTVVLAGCSSDDAALAPPVAADKGAIAGVLYDDRFRPIELVDNEVSEFQAEGFILLQETGSETRTTANGEFTFVNLAPGQYTLRVTAAGHEARPQRVEVRAGQFSEVQLEARRTTSEGSFIITTHYSVFIVCGVDFIANGVTYDCLFDGSGDSFRPGFDSDYRQHTDNATFLVTEMLADNEDRYEIQVRETGNGERYAVAQFEGDYLKIINEYNVTNEEWNAQANNVPWGNDKKIETLLWIDSPFREEAQSLLGGLACCGVGAYAGVKANFIQSLFLGPPAVDLETYCTFC